MIDMSHLTTDIQQILHNLITTYKEALSVNKFDIGKFLGFPTGITLDVREGMSAFQKEHPIKGIDKAAVDETIQGLIRAGVFSKATEGHQQYCANLNCVAKPSSSDTDFGKVQQYLNKINHHTIPKTRAAIDFRDLNKIIIEKPSQAMPGIKDLKRILPRKALVSSFDLRQMFFSVPVAHDSRKYINFWYQGVIYTHNRFPMGVSLSSYIGPQVTSITYSDDNLNNFLQMKGLTKNSKEFPYGSVKEFI